MDCLLPITAAICLIQPAGITFRADASIQAGGDFEYTVSGRSFHGGRIGRVELSLPLIVGPRFAFNVGLEHRSLIDTNRDRGEERIFAGFVYRPFGGSL